MKSNNSSFQSISLDVSDMEETSFSPLRLESSLLMILSLLILLLTVTTANLSIWQMLPYALVVFLTGFIGKKGQKEQNSTYISIYVNCLTLLCAINIAMSGYKGYDIYKQVANPCVPSDTVTCEPYGTRAIEDVALIIGNLVCLAFFVICRGHGKKLQQEIHEYTPINIKL